MVVVLRRLGKFVGNALWGALSLGVLQQIPGPYAGAGVG